MMHEGEASPLPAWQQAERERRLADSAADPDIDVLAVFPDSRDPVAWHRRVGFLQSGVTHVF
jgi:hypothetical protein